MIALSVQLHLLPQPPRQRRRRRRGLAAFTLIELLVVIAIIAILTAITVPAIRALSKSNDQSQATNLIRAMISNARSIAISQHRMAGVVFFKETAAYSLPVHGNATAMQLIVEDYNQAPYNGRAGFIPFSTARQYLPDGVEVAMLSDNVANGGISSADNTSNTAQLTRVLLFNADGQIILRDGLATLDPGMGNNNLRGTYPTAFGDWMFQGQSGARSTPTPPGQITDASSSPGFFVYSRTEMAAQTFPTDKLRADWLHNHSSVVIVNANTGSVIK